MGVWAYRGMGNTDLWRESASADSLHIEGLCVMCTVILLYYKELWVLKWKVQGFLTNLSNGLNGASRTDS